MRGMCRDCPKRDRCQELCDKALAYANQDYVGEDVFRVPGCQRRGTWFHINIPATPECQAKEIKRMHSKGYSNEDIAIHLECNEQFIEEVLGGDKCIPHQI